MPSAFKSFVAREGGSLRLLAIGMLTLVLLIPLAMVEGVIQERRGYSMNVLADIAAQHGDAQRLVGPLLVVPYVIEVEQTIRTGGSTAAGEMVRAKAERTVVALLPPRELNVHAALAHEILRRGVYEAPVYRGDIVLKGDFVVPDLARSIPNFVRADWSKAAVALTTSDLSGLARAAALETGAGDIPFAPGPPGFAAEMFDRAGARAIHAPLALDGPPTGPLSFKVALGLNGSMGFYLAPIGNETAFVLEGDWPHPSFQGAPLPADRRVDDTGFKARWNVPALAGGYGAIWTGASASSRLQDAAREAVGFRHARPEDVFVGATRAVKYGVLFVALTFLACFVLERFGGRRLHPAQYGLVGLSLALFYLLLIALAERIGLLPAYVSAGAATAGMNGAYVGAALRSLRRGIGVALSLGLLYAAFYVMLASEDDALLIGAGLLLVGLALAMSVTARMNEKSVIEDQDQPALEPLAGKPGET